MNKKFNMNKSLAGVAFTDELHTDFGAAAISIFDTNEETGHDYFRNGLIIRTASGGGGTLLDEGVDYLLGEINTSLSDEVSEYLGSSITIYRTVQITNVAYQAGDLYFSGYYHGDAVSATRENKNKNVTVAISTDGTTDNDTYGDIVEACTGGALGIQRKTPDATLCKNKTIEYVKVDSGYGAICITNDFGDTYGDTMEFILLISQYDRIKLLSDGTKWIILSAVLDFSTG
jgi:hypothetical protein